jgi:hypothetical protein
MEIEVIKTLILINISEDHDIGKDQNNQLKKLYRKLDKYKNYTALMTKFMDYRSDYYLFDKRKLILVI